MKTSQIVEKVREIVGRHQLPDFITGFDDRLGDFDGDPAMWIAFKMVPGPGRWTPETERRVGDIKALTEALAPELLEEFEDRYPYFRFEADREPKTLAS
jgi:hypothetical protein